MGSFSGVIKSQGLHTAIRSAEWILDHVDPIVETVVLCARSFILCLSDFFISSTFLVVCLVSLVFWTDQPTEPSQAKPSHLAFLSQVAGFHLCSVHSLLLLLSSVDGWI